MRILNGGFEKWQEEGRRTESGPDETAVSDSPLRVRDGRPAGMATKQDVLAAIDNGQTCIIDALAPSQFTGEDVTYARAGHIPTAVNTPFYTLTDGETARFPAADELRRRIEETTALDQSQVIAYCGGAIAATVPAFVLTLLGARSVRVYDGSLMEWTADPTLPLERSG